MAKRFPYEFCVAGSDPVALTDRHDKHAAVVNFTDLWFDPARLMVFDPETGENLTWDAEAAKTIDQENEADRKASLERAQARERASA